MNPEQRSRNQVWYVRINRKDTKSAKKEAKEFFPFALFVSLRFKSAFLRICATGEEPSTAVFKVEKKKRVEWIPAFAGGLKSEVRGPTSRFLPA